MTFCTIINSPALQDIPIDVNGTAALLSAAIALPSVVQALKSANAPSTDLGRFLMGCLVAGAVLAQVFLWVWVLFDVWFSVPVIILMMLVYAALYLALLLGLKHLRPDMPQKKRRSRAVGLLLLSFLLGLGLLAISVGDP